MNKFIWSLYAETVAFAGGLAGISKHFTRRNRPYVYQSNSGEDKNDSSATNSFFSGHEANSAALCFLTAYLVNHYTNRQVWKDTAWISAFLISGAVGYLRYSSGKHYLTDILTGYVIGAGTGFMVPHVHRNQLP